MHDILQLGSHTLSMHCSLHGICADVQKGEGLGFMAEGGGVCVGGGGGLQTHTSTSSNKEAPES